MAGPQIDQRETGNPGLIADPGNPLWKVKFKHIATGQSVAFNAWVTDFSDAFQSSWNEETAYGRMDPLVTFQNTRRTITLALDVVAANKPEAVNNTAKMDKLIRFLYPVYTESGETFANTLKSSPLMEIQWTNLIASGYYQDRGVVGYISGMTYTPTFEAGLFINSPEGQLHLYPQQLKLNVTFNVIHTHLMGWSAGNGGYIFGGDEGGDTYFPHGAGEEISAPVDGTQLPCADGPWIPDSAINISEAGRTERLMREEQAANQNILQQAGRPGSPQRRATRQSLQRNQGWNYNAGCPENNTRTPSPAEQRAAAANTRQALAAQRGADRRANQENRRNLREQRRAGEIPREAFRENMGELRSRRREQRASRQDLRRELLGLD